MKILILGEINLDVTSKYFFQTFLSIFSYRSLITEDYLSSITPKDHTVEVLKTNTKLDYNEEYDVIVILFKTSAAPRAYEVADKYRKNGKIVILSGTHPSALPNEAKKHADSIIIGSIEKLWPFVLKDLENNKLKPFYKSKDYKCRFEEYKPKKFSSTGFKIVSPIEATYGCPEKCDFCQYSNIPDGSKFYTRPFDEVISEIKSTPQKILYFKDLSLTTNPNYAKKLFKAMQGLNKKFNCHGNVNVLARDEELVRLSHEAGCIEWIVGFESFSQKTLNNAHKRANKLEYYDKAVRNIHKNKMAIIGTFVFGFDEDTTDVFEATKESIDELGLDGAIFAVLTPYPGTPIFKRLDSEGRILTYDWYKYNRKNIVFEPKNMTKEELEKGYRELTRKYNSPLRVTCRVIRGLKYGFFPGLATFAGNLGSYMASINR